MLCRPCDRPCSNTPRSRRCQAPTKLLPCLEQGLKKHVPFAHTGGHTPRNKENCAWAVHSLHVSIQPITHAALTSEKHEEARVHRSPKDFPSVGELHVFESHESIHVSSYCCLARNKGRRGGGWGREDSAEKKSSLHTGIHRETFPHLQRRRTVRAESARMHPRVDAWRLAGVVHPRCHQRGRADTNGTLARGPQPTLRAGCAGYLVPVSL